jgi:hypothetical protein
MAGLISIIAWQLLIVSYQLKKHSNELLLGIYFGNYPAF